MEQEFECNESFSMNSILDKETEQRESFIKDTSSVFALLFNQYINNNNKTENNKIINQSLAMVFELFQDMITPLYSLVNDSMMPNIFELYQMTEDLRYYFAIFNADIKMKLKDIELNSTNNKDSEYSESLLKLISIQYDNDRKPINQEYITKLSSEEQTNKIVEETTTSEDTTEEQNSSFFLLFQTFTSIIYNLQSNCEKLLLQSIDVSENNIKKQLFNYLIKRDILYLQNLVFKFKLLNDYNINNNEVEPLSFKSFSELLSANNQQKIDQIEIINNNNNLLESFQTIFSNYIERNQINVELILESFN